MAGFPLPRLAPAVLQIADPDRLHYGSDWPFTPLDTVTQLAGELEATPLVDDALKQRIFMANSLALFPRLTQRTGNCDPNTTPPSNHHRARPSHGAHDHP